MKQLSLKIHFLFLCLAMAIFPGFALASGEDLISAIEDGETEEVIRLLDAGEDINYSPVGDPLAATSPLTVAIAREQNDVTQELLRRGANIQQFGQGNGTPLMHAALKGDLDLVRNLLQRGAEVNARRPGFFDGGTALIWAPFGGNLDVLALLLEKGAKVSEKSDTGETALMGAIEAQRLDMVRLLLKRGADADQPGVWSSTLKDFGTPISNALRILEKYKAEKRPVDDLEEIVVYLYYKEFARLEVVLEKNGCNEAWSKGFVESLIRRIGAQFEGGQRPKISSLLHLSLKAVSNGCVL